MDNLISRRQAIDAFNTNLNELVVGGEENAKTVENYLNRVLDKIKCLPSAQLGTNLASLGTDAISRQAVLNGFCHSCDGWSCNPNTCCKTEWIRKLPVIQPGRKECEEREQGKCPWYA